MTLRRFLFLLTRVMLLKIMYNKIIMIWTFFQRIITLNIIRWTLNIILCQFVTRKQIKQVKNVNTIFNFKNNHLSNSINISYFQISTTTKLWGMLQVEYPFKDYPIRHFIHKFWIGNVHMLNPPSTPCPYLQPSYRP